MKFFYNKVGLLTYLLMLVNISLVNAQSTTPAGAKANWMMHGGYGIFAHYLAHEAGIVGQSARTTAAFGTTAADNASTSWNNAVNSFNTATFKAQVEASGAKWLVFTSQQVFRWMCVPSTKYNEIAGYTTGQACSNRDLIQDIIDDVVKPLGIKFIIYGTGDGPKGDPQTRAAFDIGPDGSGLVTDSFIGKWGSVMAELSRRYGTDVDGWWMDGMYPNIGWTTARVQRFTDSLKVGNSNAAIAVSTGNGGPWDGTTSAQLPQEGYIAGESYNISYFPGSNPLRLSPEYRAANTSGRFANGRQWHMQYTIGPLPGSQAGASPYTGETIANYINLLMDKGGAWSIDMDIVANGDWDSSQRAAIAKAKTFIRDVVNLASSGTISLRSQDGTNTLTPQSGLTASNAKDDNMDTYVKPSGTGNWALRIDLGSSKAFQKVRVKFAPGIYATEYKVRTSNDGSNWTDQATETNVEEGVRASYFDQVTARYVLVSSNSTSGNGMGIAEVEVYDQKMNMATASTNLLADQIPRKFSVDDDKISGITMATDGLTSRANAFEGQDYLELADTGMSYVQFDLGESKNVDRLKMYRYWNDGRTYSDQIWQLSNTADFSSGVTTVFNNSTNSTNYNMAGVGAGTDATYSESSSGKEVTFTSVNARYIRFWTSGNTHNTSTHIREVQAFENSTPPPAENVLITPTTITQSANTGGALSNYEPSRMRDNSGLSGTATVSNYTTITHNGGNGKSWVTSDVKFPNYYTTPNPKPDPVFTINLGASYSLSSIVIWGYASGITNEASNFTLEFSNDGGSTYSSSTEVVQTSSLLGSGVTNLAFSGSRTANTVRMTITDNAAGRGFSGAGGDRVGVGEIKFIGATASARLGSQDREAQLKQSVEPTVLYPNPASHRFQLDYFSSINAHGSFQLLNINGQEVIGQQLTMKIGMNTVEFDVSSLLKGVYFLKGQVGSDSILRKVIIRQ